MANASNRLRIKQNTGAKLFKKAKAVDVASELDLNGVDPIQLKLNVHIKRFDKDGNFLGEYDFHNGIVDVGLNALLGIMFHGTTQITTWSCGLINNSGFTALADADTMASHTGWTEWTSYDESTRVEWDEDAPSARAITNGSTPIEFTMSANGTLKGIFITSDSTKGGTSGTLWATAAFGSTIPVSIDDVLHVSYSVSG